MDHNHEKKRRAYLLSILPDPKNIFASKQFINKHTLSTFNELVQYRDSLNCFAVNHKRIKKQIDTKYNNNDEHNNESSQPNNNTLFGDEGNNNNNSFMILEEYSKDDNNAEAAVYDDGFMEEDNNNYYNDNNNDDNNDDDDEDDYWFSNNKEEEEKEDEIIYQMHGGGNCFEDGTVDEDDDDNEEQKQEQEQDHIKSYYSNTFDLLHDYCEKIAFKIKYRAEGIYCKSEEGIQDLFPNSSVTVKDCSVKIRNFSSKHKLPIKAELALVLLLKECLPESAKLPLHKTKYGSYVSDVDKVLEEENLIRGVKDFDICPHKGCTVFVGDDEIKYKCSSCDTNRYTNCVECTRNSKQIVNGDNKCFHSGRLAVKQLSYKCILPTIIKAILQPCFLKLINFKSYNYINGDDNNEYICDIGNSVAYKEGMTEMKNHFEELKIKSNNNFGISEKTIHVPLLFSIFFDGVQLFKTRLNIPYSPLFLTILNLPPIFRSVIGLG